MKMKTKKALSILLCICMILSLYPVSVLADGMIIAPEICTCDGDISSITYMLSQGSPESHVFYPSCTVHGSTRRESHNFIGGVCTVCGYNRISCDHEYNNYTQITSQTHTTTGGECKICGMLTMSKTENHSYTDGVCVCGYKSGGETCAHEYEYTYTQINSQIHTTTSACKKCGLRTRPITENHSYTDGVCVCGYKSTTGGETCAHEYEYTYTQMNSQLHTVSGVCKKCGSSPTNNTAFHSYTDGVCVCGYKSGGETCAHEYEYTYTQITSQTHTVSGACKKCVLRTLAKRENHSYTDGVCVCGYKSTTGVETCAHEYEYTYTQMNSQIHMGSDVCKKCRFRTSLITENHSYTDGVCVCGYKSTTDGETCAHEYEFTYTQITSQTHTRTSQCKKCGLRATDITENHSYTNGVCVCGETCAHEYGGYTYSIQNCAKHYKYPTCKKCGRILSLPSLEPHSYTDGVCVCGVTEGDALDHDWLDATCTTPKTCDICGETEGDPLDHDWLDATCTTPKTCDICGETEGDALGHKGGEAICISGAICENCTNEYTDPDSYNHIDSYNVEYNWYSYIDGTCYVNANLYCEGCGEYVDNANGDAELIKEVIPVNCLNPGSRTWTYTFTVNGKDYTESHTEAFYNDTHIVFDDNGFCTSCGGYQKPVMDPGEDPEWEFDDVYLIYNAGQLYWFADYVNNVDNETNVKLMDDIIVNTALDENSRAWIPIIDFYGTFDGNGKTVSGLYVKSTGDEVGMFGGGYYSRGTVKNLHLSNSYFEGVRYVGGIAGYYEGTIKNSFADDTVTVVGDIHTGALVGYNAGTISNCWAVGSIVGYSYGSLQNCCYLGTDEDGYDGTTAMTAEQFASGEVAWLLQNGIEPGGYWDENDEWVETEAPHVWGQTVGTDSYPVLGGATVYKVLACDGKTETYSNSSENGQHIFENGLCTKCSGIQYDYNGDGVINIIDLVRLKEILVGIPDETDRTYLDDNGIIDAADLVNLKKILLA